jgi:coproporphyrinogen III oxidase-like Fe-S oxidoreductase
MKEALRLSEAGSFVMPPRALTDSDSLLLYVHIPFCVSLCPYCSFHRVAYEESRARSYFTALGQELRMYRERGYDFAGMYIGGGTPTIQMDGLINTLDLARRLFGIREISVETNPDHLTASRLRQLRDAGVNRLSVGVQSFDDAILKAIGRYEKYGSGRDIQDKIEHARGIFDTLNLDLIFNLPVQTEASLHQDLDIIARLLPDQVTFYPLMRAASVAEALSIKLGPISYRTEKRFYSIILERMRQLYAGSTAWCFSRKPSMIDEYIIAYDAYIGAGSGAFSYFGDCIAINTFSLDEYIRILSRQRFAVDRIKKFSQREKMLYYFLMKLFGLRMNAADFEKAFGVSYSRALWPEVLLLTFLGALQETAGTVMLTDRGRYYWVMAMREFFIAVDTMRDYCRTRVHGTVQSDE